MPGAYLSYIMQQLICHPGSGEKVLQVAGNLKQVNILEIIKLSLKPEARTFQHFMRRQVLPVDHRGKLVYALVSEMRCYLWQ